MEINTWPGWQYVRKIGEGAFGKVYEIQCYENGEVRKAALKVMSFPQTPDDVKNGYEEGWYNDENGATTYYSSIISEFTKEIQIMSALKNSKNIVSYEEHMIRPHEGWVGADVLIRMELLQDFNTYKKIHSINEFEAIKIGIDICSALEMCHNAIPTILHRDIKLANIMVDENGNYKLGDFGVSRVIEGTRSAHTVAGTENHMAPEVIMGRGYNVTADIYSLGMVLYRILNNNRNPFLPAEGILTVNMQEEAKKKRINGEIIPAPRDGDRLLKEIVLKAIEYNPIERFQSASEMKASLLQCLNNEKSINNRGSSSDYQDDGSTVKILPNQSKIINNNIDTVYDDIRKPSEIEGNDFNNSEDESSNSKAHVIMYGILIIGLVLIIGGVLCGGIAKRNKYKKDINKPKVSIQTSSDVIHSSSVKTSSASEKNNPVSSKKQSSSTKEENTSSQIELYNISIYVGKNKEPEKVIQRKKGEIIITDTELKSLGVNIDNLQGCYIENKIGELVDEINIGYSCVSSDLNLRVVYKIDNASSTSVKQPDSVISTVVFLGNDLKSVLYTAIVNQGDTLDEYSVAGYMTPTLTGYEFEGWALGSQSGPRFYFDSTIITGNVTLYPVYSALETAAIPSGKIADAYSMQQTINNLRENNGLTTLAWSDSLASVAQNTVENALLGGVESTTGANMLLRCADDKGSSDERVANKWAEENSDIIFNSAYTKIGVYGYFMETDNLSGYRNFWCVVFE